MVVQMGGVLSVDVGKHFVKATYFLEGDGPLVFSCYEKLSAVSQFCQTLVSQTSGQLQLQLPRKTHVRT